ncbi:MAG: insulinase family protein [Anaerolineales bacterium]|jgi:zinc protease|nr:insulinase family protein [Anaerolineales bacterium]
MKPEPVEHSLPGPETIRRAVLDNGIVVLARANFNSPSVVISGYLTAGNLLEPDEKLGLAGFTASMLMRGTVQRSFQQIYDALESVGAGLGFNGSTHTTSFSGRSLVEDLDLLLELTEQALYSPSFPEAYIERLRAQLLTGLAIRAQDTEEMASLAFDKIVYANHPYSRAEDGYPETIQAITRQDLVDFHQRCYGPRGMVISIVGGVEPEAAIEKINQALGNWNNPQQCEVPELPSVSPLAQTIRQHIHIPGKSQVDLMLGCVGPARSSPDYLTAALGNSILGQFGMYGRIGERVRTQAGLAYYAYSSMSGGWGPGPWYAAAGIDPPHLDQTIALILEEIQRFVDVPVSDQELGDCQAQFIGSLPLSMESNGGVASALLNLERYQLGLDYYQHYPKLIGSITPAQVLETARRYLDPTRMAIVAAGSDLPQ